MTVYQICPLPVEQIQVAEIIEMTDYPKCFHDFLSVKLTSICGMAADPQNCPDQTFTYEKIQTLKFEVKWPCYSFQSNPIERIIIIIPIISKESRSRYSCLSVHWSAGTEQIGPNLVMEWRESSKRKGHFQN